VYVPDLLLETSGKPDSATEILTVSTRATLKCRKTTSKQALIKAKWAPKIIYN